MNFWALRGPAGDMGMATAQSQFLVARFNTDGTLDSSFGTSGTTIPPYGNILSQKDATGNRLPITPDATVNLNVHYEHETQAGTLQLDVGGYYNSGFFGQPQQSYTINVLGTATGAGGATLQHSWPVTLTVQ